MQHHQEVTNSETLLLPDSDHKHAAAVVKNNIQHEEASKTLTHINTCRVIFTLRMTYQGPGCGPFPGPRGTASCSHPTV